MGETAKDSDQLFNKIRSAGTDKISEDLDEVALLRKLRKVFPHGHAEFNPMTLKEMKLHSEKNFDYAAGGDPLGNFNRVAVIMGMYPNLLLSNPVVIAIVYAMKQIDACLWMLSQNREGKIEDVNSRLGDVSVYVKLAMILHGQGKVSYNTPIEPVTETWALENAKPFANKPPTEHECWGGWSDGPAVDCKQTTAQRNEGWSKKKGEK